MICGGISYAKSETFELMKSLNRVSGPKECPSIQFLYLFYCFYKHCRINQHSLKMKDRCTKQLAEIPTFTTLKMTVFVIKVSAICSAYF